MTCAAAHRLLTFLAILKNIYWYSVACRVDSSLDYKYLLTSKNQCNCVNVQRCKMVQDQMRQTAVWTDSIAMDLFAIAVSHLDNPCNHNQRWG